MREKKGKAEMPISKKIKSLFVRGIWAVTGIKKNRVVFTSFTGRSYSDNPKAISEKLHSLDERMEIVWINQGKPLGQLPAYAKQVSRRDAVQYQRTLASASVIVDNAGFELLPKKK